MNLKLGSVCSHVCRDNFPDKRVMELTLPGRAGGGGGVVEVTLHICQVGGRSGLRFVIGFFESSP